MDPVVQNVQKLIQLIEASTPEEIGAMLASVNLDSLASQKPGMIEGADSFSASFMVSAKNAASTFAPIWAGPKFGKIKSWSACADKNYVGAEMPIAGNTENMPLAA